MCEDSDTLCVCAFGGILTTISKKWSLLIINRLGISGRLRFNDLMTEFAGISPRTLSETLKELQKERLIGRESFAETPPRVEYFLTEDGAELRKVIVPFLRWASERDNANWDRCEEICRCRTCHPKGVPCARKTGQAKGSMTAGDRTGPGSGFP